MKTFEIPVALQFGWQGNIVSTTSRIYVGRVNEYDDKNYNKFLDAHTDDAGLIKRRVKSFLRLLIILLIEQFSCFLDCVEKKSMIRVRLITKD